MQGLQSKASGSRGVGRYTESLVKEILRKKKRHEFFLALNGALDESIEKIKRDFSGALPKENIILWQNFIDTSANKLPADSNIAAAEIIREMFFQSYSPDIIFSTNLQEGLFEPAVTSVKRIADSGTIFFSTLHDTVPFYYEKQYLSDPTTRKWYFSKIKGAKDSEIILTVSNSSKDDIVKFLDVKPEKIFVIENGYNKYHFNTTPIPLYLKEKVLLKYGIAGDFIFYVGGNDPHKNIENLIRAYASDASIYKNKNLVLGGSHFLTDSNISNLISHFGLDEKIVRPGFIDDKDLPVLYKSCSCFIFPSTHEGFGLPALEAMACGAPTIGSKSSSIGEIIGNDEALFDPHDYLDIAKYIKSVIFNKKFAEILIQKGLQQANKYSWENSAEKLLSLFDKFGPKIQKKQNPISNYVKETISLIAEITPRVTQENIINISESIAETFEEPRRPKFYLDLSVVVINDDKSGIQRVARAISKELLNLENNSFDVEVVYTKANDFRFFSSEKFNDISDCNKQDHTLFDNEKQVTFNKNDVLVFLDLYPAAAITHQKFLHYLRNKGVRIFHVIYDILPILKPEKFWPELCKEFNLWAQAVSSSDGALCISKSVADELKKYLTNYGNKRVTQFNIGWFHLGADIANSLPSTGGIDETALLILEKINKTTSFLMVSTIEPRKGHRQTLKAFELLWNEQLPINLVIVGRIGWGMSEFQEELMNHPQLGNHLIWLNGISDEYLEKVYDASSCLISASEGEGFGLPLIEAAQHKIPIILRDIPVFREVVGSYGYYFDNNTSPETISKSIRDWINLYLKGEQPLSDGMPYLTWKQSAEQLLDLINGNKWEHTVFCKNALLPGFLYDFCSERLVFRGFSAPEQGFRWSDGNESSIKFYWADADGKRQVKLHFGTFGKQKITILLNNEKILVTEAEGDTEIIFDTSLISSSINHLKLLLPNAKQPNESDKRFLALSFRDLEILEELRPINFNETCNFLSQKLSFRGFSGAEDAFKWSDGNKSAIDFYWAENKNFGKIHILCNSMQDQNIKISLNGVDTADFFIDGDSIELSFLATSLKQGFNRIDIFLPDARQPNTNDSRLLALAFREMKICI